MPNYKTVLEELQPVFREHVITHKFVTSLLSGHLPTTVYASYLRETFHLVRETPNYLAAAAARTGDDWLQDWLLDVAVEERHHDRLCVNDLRSLGYEPEAYLRQLPGSGVWAMIGQNHYLALRSNPVGILGFAAATEGLGASLGPSVAAAMRQYPWAAKASSFLRVHAAVDQDHAVRVARAFDRLCSSPENLKLMTMTWAYTIRSYGQLFSDSIERAN